MQLLLGLLFLTLSTDLLAFEGERPPLPIGECATPAAGAGGSLEAVSEVAAACRRLSVPGAGPVSSSKTRISLTSFIARIVSHNPTTHPLRTLEELHTILSSSTLIPPERERLYQRMTKILAQYQFADIYAIRELIANGLDSYYYQTTLKDRIPLEHRTVDVHTREGEVEIVDHGAGMSPGDIAYFLLTPGQSKNNVILNPDEMIQGVTGRFGQGFFSALSFLKNSRGQVGR